MIVKSQKEDRKDLVKALEKVLDQKSTYRGAPSFIYDIGPYMVLRNGDLEVEDSEADENIIKELAMKGFIQEPGLEPTAEISIPMENLDGRTLMNIVFRINSKDALLSKVFGQSENYRISETFISELDSIRPETKEDFIDVLSYIGGNEENKGISFTEEKVTFSFPQTLDGEVLHAYSALIEMMIKEAESKRRIRPESIGLTENEKYSFRNWIVTLGMSGDEYKADRAILLRNLTGHIAYRTRKQAEEQGKKWAEIRRERREQECSEFHVL